MKSKRIMGLIVLMIICGGIWKLYQSNYGGDTYYTQILVTPEKNTNPDTNYTFYNYDQRAFSEKKEMKVVHMNEYRDFPLRLNAYLKLLVNDKKGVITWEEVDKKDVPKKVIEQMQDKTNLN